MTSDQSLKILLLINKKSRSGDGAYNAIEYALQNAGHKVIDLSHEEDSNDCKKLIKKYHQQIDLIVVGGGDGSINHVLPELVEVQIPLVVYPLGTANLLARSFNIKADIQELIHLVENGKTVQVDLGLVNDIYFINVCGLGISTEVNRSISPILKKLTGPLSFWLTGLKLSPKLKSFKMKLAIDGMPPITTRSWQITICNGRKYAAWMTIEPNATYDDGTLHCLSTEVKKWWQGFKMFFSYVKGRYKVGSELTFAAGREIKIETKKSLQIDVDGDVKTCTPAVFKVHPKALKLVIPQISLEDSSPITG